MRVKCIRVDTKEGATDQEIHVGGFYDIHGELPSAVGNDPLFFELTSDRGNLITRPATCFRIMEKK